MDSPDYRWYAHWIRYPLYLPAMLQLSGRCIPSSSRICGRSEYLNAIRSCSRLSTVHEADVQEPRCAVGRDADRVSGCTHDSSSLHFVTLWGVSEKEKQDGSRLRWPTLKPKL